MLTMMEGLITFSHNPGFAGREAGAWCLKQQVTSVQHSLRILCQNSNSSCCRSEGQKLPHSWIHWTSKAGHAILSYSLLTILNARVKLPFVEDKKKKKEGKTKTKPSWLCQSVPRCSRNYFNTTVILIFLATTKRGFKTLPEKGID